MNLLNAGITETKELISDIVYDMIPEVVHAGISAGFRDERIQTIVGGVSLMAAGLGTIQASGIPKTIYSWFSQTSPADPTEKNVKEKFYRWTGALIGAAGVCVGVSIAAMGVFQFMECLYPYEEGSDGEKIPLGMSCFSRNPHMLTKKNGYLEWIPKCTYPFPGPGAGPDPDCVCTNPDQHLETDPDCIFGRDEIRWNYHCKPGAHSDFSPITGIRAFEIERLYQDPETFQILKDLEYELYNDGPTGGHFRQILDKNDRTEIDLLANEMYSRFLDRYRPYGINEMNVVYRLSEEQCFWGGLPAGGGFLGVKLSDDGESWLRQVISCEKGHYDFLLNIFLPEGLVNRHELMHLEEWSHFRKHKIELFTVTRDLIELDEIHKKINHIDLSTEVDYDKEIPILSRISKGCDDFKIPLGKFINFYRELEATKPNLAETLTSKESIEFLTSCESEMT